MPKFIDLYALSRCLAGSVNYSSIKLFKKSKASVDTQAGLQLLPPLASSCHSWKEKQSHAGDHHA